MIQFLRQAFFLVAFLVANAFGAFAQQDQPANALDFDAWGNVATRAETAIENRLASDRAFESLRSEIVVWRDRFLDAQGINTARIETLTSQIEALGPGPTEGATETEEIANRRIELATQLAEAEAPVRAVVEAYNRADGLANEIDVIIRTRQADALLNLGPTPLNPAIWPTAMQELTGALQSLWDEISYSWSSENQRLSLQNELPRVLFLLLIAGLILLRGQAVADRTEIWLLKRSPVRAQRLVGFLFSLAEVLLFVIGLYVLTQAVAASGLTGLRLAPVIAAIPLVGLYVFGARWLGQILFSNPEISDRSWNDRTVTGQLRSSATLLGLFVGLLVILEAIGKNAGFSPGTTAVLLAIPLVLSGATLFQIGRAIVTLATPAERDEFDAYRARWVRFFGRGVVALAAASVILILVGYLDAGRYLIVATTMTLGLLAILILVDELIRTTYAVLIRAESDEAQRLLLPTLLSLAAVVLALPLFALIWGARQADLTELWAITKSGFNIGETRISPEAFLTFVFVFMVLFIATRVVQGALRVNVLPKTKIDPGGQTAIVSGIGYLGIFLAALIAITSAGIDLSSLALVAGALSVGIGFGLQNIVQNFVAGIILLIERPVAEGDWIEVGGSTGIVKKISVRSTLIETFDRYEIIVPNGDFISSAVSNWTRQDLIGRVKVPVGVAYGTDTRKVTEILRAIAVENPMVSMTPEPAVDFLGFGADSMDFQIRAVLRDVNYIVSVRTELNHRIAERFVEEGIEIPFAQRDIWLRNPEALSNAGQDMGGPAANAAFNSKKD